MSKKRRREFTKGDSELEYTGGNLKQRGEGWEQTPPARVDRRGKNVVPTGDEVKIRKISRRITL